jgi:hypothetical protein
MKVLQQNVTKAVKESDTRSVEGIDEKLVKRLMQKIIVFNDHFTVKFKSCVSVEIQG